ncbi:ArsR/SmtB family transcription factor [Perlabentimonas gracilis]|uniref:ArsR/SmtB family transcription factor n=1 Tax=Perlabentimonas gracilis TaxID=2715279 RepID=UPI0014086C5C|nr:metalloregulator ArsR/SmtB family transcription factor [Perlabentimonas gracilis]NHB69410.1 winged helix-turn-helix transcriptional regulator [Perlabentimonas gracilis]
MTVITNIYQKEAGIFKALSHPTRLFILDVINKEPHTVSELADMVGIDISTMSKHLDIMKRYQIVVGEKNKNSVYYKLNIPCLFEFFKCAQRISTSDHSGCQAECFMKIIK